MKLLMRKHDLVSPLEDIGLERESRQFRAVLDLLRPGWAEMDSEPER